jgi:cell division protein ZapA
MGTVNATIAGRQFRLACEDGQEEHLQGLAHDIDQRIINLRARFGEIGDTRLTVMAALMVADELEEAARKSRLLEDEIAALKDARVVAADRAKAASDAVVAFNSAAERLEGITRKLNQTLPAGHGVGIG